MTFVHYRMGFAIDCGFIPCCHGWDNSNRNLYNGGVILKAHRMTSELRIIWNNLGKPTMTVLPSNIAFFDLI